MTGDAGEALEHGLRHTSDSLVATLDELYALEDEKRSLVPGSARFVELASRIESLARSALDHTRTQEALAEQSMAVAGTPASAETPIDQVPARPVSTILAEWRAAERRLDEAGPGSPDADLVSADIRRLRAEYRRAVGDKGGGPAG